MLESIALAIRQRHLQSVRLYNVVVLDQREDFLATMTEAMLYMDMYVYLKSLSVQWKTIG